MRFSIPWRGEKARISLVAYPSDEDAEVEITLGDKKCSLHYMGMGPIAEDDFQEYQWSFFGQSFIMYDPDFRKKLFNFFGAPLDTYDFDGAYELRALFHFITNRSFGYGPRT